MNNPQTTTASLWRRLAAMGYDTLLAIPLMMAVTASTIALRAALISPEAIQHSQTAALTGTWYWLNLLLACIAAAAFFIVCWIRGGRTLGMQAWRLRVQQSNGQPLTVRLACLRLMGATVSMACCGLGYLWILYDRQSRSWHDIWSSTQIVLLPKPPKSR